jgi:hypothetical protein
MIVINTVSSTKFSFNGITYHKNFMPFVTGNKIAILNVYDGCIFLTDAPTHFSEYIVNGVSYASVNELQEALLDVIYTRLSLSGGGGGGTLNTIPKFSATGLEDSLLSQSGNQINLGTYAAFGVNNPGTPGDPGVDNDAYIGSIINNDFLIKVNNTEALRIDTALRLKIANIQNATYDTDKFLVSDGGIVKYRTGAELLSDIGGASAGDLSGYVTLATAQTITGAKTLTSLLTGTRGSFASNGSSDTFGINHSSGSGIGLNITKGGNGEGLYINKTSGSGNAATIIGTLNATTLVKSGGTSSQFLKADGSIDSNSYALASSLTNYVTLDTAQTITGAKSFTANVSFGVGSPTAIESATGRIITDKFRLYNAIPATNYHDFASSASQNRTITVPDATGTMALTSDLGAYLPLAGGTLTSSGSANTLNINHTSGSGIALNILKNGNGEGLTIVKGSGSGNAASITGGITLLSELNLTTKLADAHIASAATWNAKIGGSGTINYLAKFTASGVVGNSAVQEVSGNLGLGVTPSAWGTNFRAIQLVGGSLYTNAGGTTGQIGIGQNWYFDGSSNKYLNNAAASDYYQFAGEHRWFTAPSGTAGNAISFTQAMTLDDNGNLLIGTKTSNNYPLGIEANSSGNHIYLKRSGAYSEIYMGGTTSGGTQLFIRSGGSGGVRLDSAATSWVSASDERLKNIISNIENATEKLNTLRAVNYTWKSDKENSNNLGLIAQDVIKVFPEIVSESSKDGMYGVKYTELIPVLVKAIQELNEKIKTLENK